MRTLTSVRRAAETVIDTSGELRSELRQVSRTVTVTAAIIGIVALTALVLSVAAMAATRE